MRALKLANLGISAVIQAADCNEEIQCGCVLLLIWKMMLLDFFGSKFCKKCEHSLACFQFFYLANSLWTPLGSDKRVCLKEVRHVKEVEQSRDQL